MIIPKEEIKFVFNEPIMQPGDILLMNTYESQRRLMPGCIYDHAAIYLGDAFLMEADGTGVVMNHIYSYAFREAEHGCILRLKTTSHKIIDDMLFWIRSRMAMEFGTQQARMVNTYRNSDKKDQSNRTFCSRLVAQAYHQAGIDVVSNPDYCAPDDFLSSNQLEQISPSLQTFTEEMILTVMNSQNKRNSSEWNTCLAEMFENMRHLYGDDIQTMDQLLISAVHHTDKDDEAIDLLKKQKWMTPPSEQTKLIWPWFCDDDTFFKHFPTIQDVMFFLNNQFLHYDKTYLPIFRENAMNLSIFAKLRPDSQVVQLIHQHIKDILDEAIAVRRRLEYLYVETFSKDEQGFLDFCKECGHYEQYEYKEGVIDISRTLQALLEYGPSNIGDYLKEEV